jgi:hypothetical protein
VEPLDLALVGSAGVPGQDTGHKHRQKPEPCATVAAP